MGSVFVELLLILFGLIMLICVGIVYFKFGFNNIQEENVAEVKLYEKKKFMTRTELEFYDKFKELEDEYRIVPQINLATIIKKISKGYINELFKNIDFAIFDKQYNDILLLIELNDSSHNNVDRRDRDLKVQKICRDANIKLITFHTKYPNEKEYVLNRIKENLINKNE